MFPRLFIIMVAVFLLNSIATAKEPSYEVLILGVYPSAQAADLHGSVWTGVFPSGHSAVYREVPLIVGPASSKSSVEYSLVSVPFRIQQILSGWIPHILFRGSALSQDTKIKTLYSGPLCLDLEPTPPPDAAGNGTGNAKRLFANLNHSESVSIYRTGGGKKEPLIVFRRSRVSLPGAVPLFGPSDLVVSVGNTEQNIGHPGDYVNLRWLGFLDGDERPDFVLWARDKENEKGRLILFLSSMANSGEVVAKVFERPGPKSEWPDGPFFN